MSYTTVIDKIPVTLGLRNYQEFDALHRWEGNATLATATVKF